MIHKQHQMHSIYQEIAAVAMCNEKNVKYYTNLHRPARFRQDT